MEGIVDLPLLSSSLKMTPLSRFTFDDLDRTKKGLFDLVTDREEM